MRTLRKKVFQRSHERALHYSKVFMNHWGGATLEESGELVVMRTIAAHLVGVGSPVLFDVGANSGGYSKALLRTFPEQARIFAFEPSLATYTMLSEKVAAGQLGSTVQCFNLGFGHEEATAQLHADVRGSAVATLWPDRSSTSGRRRMSEPVRLTTVDIFCAEQGLTKIDFLKLDVEGHELSILQGAARLIGKGQIRFIQFEFGECQMNARQYFRDFNDLLAPRYDLYRIVRDGLWPLASYTTDQEIFSTANFLAVLKTSPLSA